MVPKRGSLAIGTNAIVTLIITVIMLGLIIGLVTQGFQSAERQLNAQLENIEDPVTPSSRTPITASPQNLFADRGEEIGMKISILNTHTGTINASPKIDCQGISSMPDFDVFNQDIDVNDRHTFLSRLTIPSSAADGEYLCRIRARNNTDILDSIRAYELTLTVG